MFEHLLNGFAVALQPMNLLIALVGCLVGTLIGVLPGLGPTATLAMLIPLVFSMPPATAMILLTSVYYGSMYGGSTTSILVNIPGESASVITCLDGNKMALQGRAGPALAIAAIGSFIAGTFAVLVLTLVGAPVAGYALHFGPAEFFALMVFGLSTVASLTGTNVVKSVITTCFGLMIATVGIDLVSGRPPVSPSAIPSSRTASTSWWWPSGCSRSPRSSSRPSKYARGPGRRSSRRSASGSAGRSSSTAWPSIFRGTVFGFLVGMLPGAGATLSTFIAYNLEKRICKHPERLGTGDIRGSPIPRRPTTPPAGPPWFPCSPWDPRAAGPPQSCWAL